MERDSMSVAQHLRYLGPKGKDMSTYVPPGGKVDTAFIYFVPQQTAKK